MIWKIATGVLLVITLATLLFGNQYRKERDLYKNKVQNDFNTKYLLLERRFQQSERQRLVLGDSLTHLDSIGKGYFQLNEDLLKQIRKIRGSYEKKTPSELEGEMTNRYNKSLK